MAKELRSGEKPDDEPSSEPGQQGDDILSDSSIEELDLESLLAEDLTEVDSKEPHGSKSASSPKEGAVIDDGEIDLLSDDVLSLDDGVEEIAAEGATNGQKMSGGAASSEIVNDVSDVMADDLSGIDLLADDPDPTPTHPVSQSESSPAAAAASAVGAAALSGLVHGSGSRAKGDEATAVHSKGDSGSEEADNAPSSGKKSEKKKPGKGFLKFGKKSSEPEPVAEEMKESVPMAKGNVEPSEEGAENAAESPQEGSEQKGAKGLKAGKKEKAKKGAGKRAAVKEPAREKVRPAAAVRVGGSVAFVCSECYEEFLLPSNYSQEMVSCPECLHVGKRPDEDFLRTVNLHKAGEKKSFLLAIGAAVVLAIVLFGLLWMTSDLYITHNKGQAPDKNLVLGFLGGSALLSALVLWLAVRYEGNRWEVYF